MTRRTTTTGASQILEVKDNRPDIAVTGITVSSNNVNVTSGTQGERVVISFEVQNRGLVDAPTSQ